MDHSELKTRLPKDLASQLDILWQRFARKTGQTDIDRFLSWLQNKGHLSPEQYQQLFVQEDVEVTGFDQAETFLEGMGLGINGSPGAAPNQRPQYEMLSMLGKGAMGLVHLAKDRDLQRKVAYKQLLGQGNRSALARFVREAQITAQLDHPHIVPIYGMEVQADGSLAYSMKLVKGKTFKELIRETRAFYDQGQQPDEEHSLPQLLDDFLKACDAVAFAHAKGVIHRDLKPANIMVGQYNEVYVMDWGIARVMLCSDDMPPGWVELSSAGGDELLDDKTHAGQILGTPRYMSPQQAAGKNDELDGRSDEFALGLILYELITLKPAFAGSLPIDLLKKVLKADKEPWHAYHPSRRMDPELQAIVDKATAQKPHQRYAGVSEMANDLRRHLHGEAPVARPDNGWRQLLRWVGRHRGTSVWVCLIVVLFAAAGIIAALVQQQQAMIQARQREARLLAFYTHIAQQGQHLDSYFQNMQALVQSLATVTTQTLTHPLPQAALAQEPLHLNDAFAQPPHKRFEAPDLIASPYYTGEISPGWPTYLLSPGVKAHEVMPLLRQLAPLRSPLRQILIDSYTQGHQVLSGTDWAQLLAHQGVPVLWSYVCLKQGILYFYPGHEEASKDYDVRVRPYYLQSKDKRGTVWGKPYQDPDIGLLIAASQGLFGESGQFLGTVGIDISLHYLRDHYLKPNEHSAVRKSALLNEKGEVLLNSQTQARPRHELGLTETAVTPPYPVPAVVEAVRHHQAGGTLNLAGQPNETARLIVYIRLNTLGWYYVVEATPADVLTG